MRLRGRFTLTFALAALGTIGVATAITQKAIGDQYRKQYEERRRNARTVMERQVKQLTKQVHNATDSLAGGSHPLISGVALLIANDTLTAENLRQYRTSSESVRRSLTLEVLTITAPDDEVLIAPHYRDALGKTNPQIRLRAQSTRGASYFAMDKIRSEGDVHDTLVAQATQLATDRGVTLAVATGRSVDDELLAPVRGLGGVDARIVTPSGRVLVPPAAKDWRSAAVDPIEIALLGPDQTTVASIQVTVSDADLEALLWDLTWKALALALTALGAFVLIGLIVARRTARDLDLLVEGSLAASRGDLDHRVPVRSKDEVGAVAAAFNFMMEDLRMSKERLVIAERIAAWQEIARRLAHEIKNPLTPIQMAMDTLRKTWKKKHPSFDEILEESTSTVLQEADRLKHIVAEFTDFARMPKPEFQRIELDDVIRSAVSLYQGSEGGARVETKLANNLPHVDADKNQINQVILNLVENARDAIGQRTGGRITISTRLGDAGDRVLLVVEDNGPGVPSELKDKVFAPYFSTKHSKGGTGLGLAIVHRIVSDHGGRIAVSDAPGGGARFAIELPLRNGTALLVSRI